MKKLLIALTVILTFCLTAFPFTACEDDNREQHIPHMHNYRIIECSSCIQKQECDCGVKQIVELHHGGVATCTSKAICGVCNIEYGELDDHKYIDGKCKWCEKVKPQYVIDDNNEDIIYFGRYPQTLKEEEVTVSTTANANGYFIGSDGEEYAKVSATPYSSEFEFSNGSEIVTKNTYYFKLEPIRWRILNRDGEIATILCDNIIENKRYDGNSNNYAWSELRTWLNNEFYNIAFNNYEQNIIQTVIVDNSVKSTGLSVNQGVCEDTQDKVYLLSYLEAYNITGNTYSCKERLIETSDYAKATGVKNGYYYGEGGCWWLRSPTNSRSLAFYVNEKGYLPAYGQAAYVYRTCYGVVPALKIQL